MDAGCRMQDSGCRMQDSGSNSNTIYEEGGFGMSKSYKDLEIYLESPKFLTL
jgi:hypothetical protein